MSRCVFLIMLGVCGEGLDEPVGVHSKKGAVIGQVCAVGVL